MNIIETIKKILCRLKKLESIMLHTNTNFNYYNTVIINNNLPNTFVNTELSFICLDFILIEDLDVSNYLPNVRDGCEIRIRKICNTEYKIIYNDSILNYNFVDLQGDFMSFIKVQNKLIIK